MTRPGDDETSTIGVPAMRHGVEVVDHPLEQPRPHILDEVLVGDPFKLNDRNPARCTSGRGNQPAVIQPAETVLKAVISPQQERASNQPLTPENPWRTETWSSRRATFHQRPRKPPTEALIDGPAGLNIGHGHRRPSPG